MASSNRNELQIYDEVRKCWVRATPEEKVRQQWLHRMIHQLHYPKELIVVEKELKELVHLEGTSPPDRRVDILCYGKRVQPLFYPLLLIECKQFSSGGEGSKMRQNFLDRALDQVIGYNDCVQAKLIAVACDSEIRVGFRDHASQRYLFGNELPKYQELVEWVKH